MLRTPLCVYRENFHKELRAFMKDLIKVFPNDRDIKLASSSLNIALMDDPKDTVIKDFYKAMQPCESYINTRNDALFTERVIRSDIALFSHLEDYWVRLDDTNKETVWAYLTVLYSFAKTFYVQIN